MECNKDEIIVTDVFAYIDQGLKSQITRLSSDKFELDPDIDRKGQVLEGLLVTAEEQARVALNLDNNKPPKFHYVGLRELTTLLNELWTVDPSLLKPGIFLGENNAFTYDSPKFVEAVIRLARGDIPHLAKDPIIRIDDDAKINPKSIKILLDQFESSSRNKPFYFFSGRYGREDGILDIVNDFAVRTHWFFPSGTLAGEQQFEKPSPDFHNRMVIAETFLCDLQVLGARQPLLPESKISSKLYQAIKENRVKNIKERISAEVISSPQVISGAGLIMARRNIALLPPFINCKNLITWIDDYLKRELHEMLGDISKYDPQCILDAKFEQDRHSAPEGITEKYIKSINSAEEFLGKNDYLKRVLLGCMFSAIIGDQSISTNNFPDGSEAKNYTGIIKDIVVYRLEQNNFKVNEDALKNHILGVAFEHYKLVLDCWTSEEYKEYESYHWASKLLTNLNELDIKNISMDNAPSPVRDIVEDAMNYLTLVFNWHKFTRAIERLEFLGNRWLYKS